MEHWYEYHYNKRLKVFDVFVDGHYEGTADTPKAARMLGNQIKKSMEENENG